ncbi:MAG: hypothetical protein ACI4EV_05995 [Lachnospiraceae bacterium]
MKRKIILLTLLTIIIGCTACKDNVNENSSVPETKEENHSQENSSEEVTEIKYTHRVPLNGELYIDVPNYLRRELGTSVTYLVEGSRFFSVTVNTTGYDSNITDIGEAYDITLTKLKRNVDAICEFIGDPVITESSYETIKGRDVYKYKGTIPTDSKPEGIYMYGYTFIENKVAVSIVGFIIEKDQRPDNIQEITRVVDEVMQSVRNAV